MYTVLGIFASNTTYVVEEKRYQILEWAINRLLGMLAACPADNVDKMSRIVMTIKTTTKNFNKPFHGKFVDLMKLTIERLVPLLGRYMNHQMLVKQVIFFVQSNVSTLGLEILPVMQQLAQECISAFPFEKLEDILILLNFSAATLKRQALLLICASMNQLFVKVSQHSLPASNTSDEDMTLNNLNALFLRLIVTSLEEIGIDVYLNQDNAQMIEPLVDWLIVHFKFGCRMEDKKSVLRATRFFFMGLRAIGPNSQDAKARVLADVFLNKRSKEQWQLAAMLTPDVQNSSGILPQSRHEAVVAKIIEMIASSAGVFHLQPKSNLESMQCAKVIVELLVLVYHAGFSEYLAHYFSQAFGLDASQIQAFFTLFEGLVIADKDPSKHNGLQSIQTYFQVLVK